MSKQVSTIDVWQAYRRLEHIQRFFTDAFFSLQAELQAQGITEIDGVLPSSGEGDNGAVSGKALFHRHYCDPPFCFKEPSDLALGAAELAESAGELAKLYKKAAEVLGDKKLKVYPILDDHS